MNFIRNNKISFKYTQIIILVFLISIANINAEITSKEENKFSCKVNSIDKPVVIDAQWNKKPWTDTKAETLNNFMGDKPAHFPETQFKLRYDDKNIYVIFQVKDRFVRAVAKEVNGRVWEDSCVEFFFTPGPDIKKGYFNLEANCKGVFLLGYTMNSKGDRGRVDAEDCKKITISNSLQQNVETEIAGPVTWSVEYAIPFAMLDKYTKVDKPAPGVKWRANFFKCADKTSHPHWLTWAPVINPTPKFHLPEYFGWLEF